jgi:uncharacterized membrane protein YvbJ
MTSTELDESPQTPPYSIVDYDNRKDSFHDTHGNDACSSSASILRSLRDNIIKNDNIDKKMAILVSSLCSTSELMLLELHYKKDKEIQSAKHEVEMLQKSINERDRLQSITSDVAKLVNGFNEQVVHIQTLGEEIENLKKNLPRRR